MVHTIILYQRTRDANSCTYMQFEDVNTAMNSIMELYEKHLKQRLSHLSNITYTLSELFHWIDNEVIDLSALVFDHSKKAYEPCSKDWIKEKIYSKLKYEGAAASRS